MTVRGPSADRQLLVSKTIVDDVGASRSRHLSSKVWNLSTQPRAKRRTDVVVIFRNDDLSARLVEAPPLEVATNGPGQRARYITLESVG